jgi:hypothetical protein
MVMYMYMYMLIQPTAVTTLCSDPTHDTSMGCMLDLDHSRDSVVLGSYLWHSDG